MRNHPRPAIAAVIATGTMLIAPLAVMADTGPVPEGGLPVVDPADPGAPIWLFTAVLIAGVLGTLVVRRPAWRRPIASLITVAGTLLVAFFVLALGVMSSWTDRGDNIPAPFLIGAIATVAAGLIVAARILLGGRPRRLTPEAGSPTSPPDR
jgi:hypothetical protein